MTIRDKVLAKPKIWASAGLLTAGLAGGAVIGSSLSAGAATSTTNPSGAPAPSPDSSSSGGTSTDTPPSMPPHGSAAHEAAETAVTGSVATQAQAAAVKYLGGGTAGSVTTDCTKKGYEVTVTKSDGSQVEVHEDSSFNVIQGGLGHGGGGRGGPPSARGNSAST